MKTVFHLLSEKNHAIHFLGKFVCEMDFKVGSRSRTIATVALFWSKLDEIVSTSCKTASVADFFLKSFFRSMA